MASCLGTDFELDLADGENGLDNMKQCQKNPGHKSMHPITELTMDHLPEKWRKAHIFGSIQVMAHLTVKIIVSYVSPNRPDKYCNPMFRGTRLATVGTGIADLIDKPHSQSLIDCPFKNCSTMTGCHKVTPVFEVHTATHVVFDNMEAEHTLLEFFYDSPDRSSVVGGQVVSLDSSNSRADVCTLLCVSHDLTLMQKLRAKIDRLENCTGPSSSLSMPNQSLAAAPEPAPLVLVIGHPHGCYKHVSFGQWVGWKPEPTQEASESKLKDFLAFLEANVPDWRVNGWKRLGNFTSPGVLLMWEAKARENPDLTVEELLMRRRQNLASITYTADTCPGSSGASVTVFFQNGNAIGMGMSASHFRHRKGKGNASGRAIVYDEWKENVTNYSKNISVY